MMLLDYMPLTKRLPRPVKLEICKRLTRNDYPTGTVIVAEGEPADGGFWIRSGQLRVSRAELSSKPLATFIVLGGSQIFVLAVALTLTQPTLN